MEATTAAVIIEIVGFNRSTLSQARSNIRYVLQIIGFYPNYAIINGEIQLSN
jgi:hypothetical protein